MKKLIVALTAAISLFASARPPAPHAYRAHPPPMRPHHHYYRHHYGPTAPFALGLGAGLVFGSITRPLPPPPPVVAVNPVWIQPVYATRPVFDQFGQIVRYEQVLVRAGYWEYR